MSKQEEGIQKQPLSEQTMSYRQHTKNILEQMIKESQTRGRGLSIILSKLPWKELTPEEEATLHSFFIEIGMSLR
jgi:hypothetical protein